MDEAGVKPSDIQSLADLSKLPFMKKQFLRDNPEACAKIEAQVRELFGLEADPVKADTDAKPETKSKAKE